MKVPHPNYREADSEANRSLDALADLLEKVAAAARAWADRHGGGCRCRYCAFRGPTAAERTSFRLSAIAAACEVAADDLSREFYVLPETWAAWYEEGPRDHRGREVPRA